MAGRLLARHLNTGARLDFLLENSAGQLSPVDARRCRHLLFGTVRHLGLLDSALREHLHTRPRTILRAALLLGAFELLEHADEAPVIVHHAVEQTRRLTSASEARVVNAVLRRVSATLATALAADAAATEAGAATNPVGNTEALARRFSHPAWLVERWLARFGAVETRQLLEWNQQPAPVHARMIGAPTADAAPLPDFFKPTRWPGFFLLDHPEWEVVERLLSEGRIYLQDPATALAPGLLGVVPGETVLDVCAAPGGKSLQLAEAISGAVAGGRLVAVDLPGPRLARLRENLARHPTLAPLVAVAGIDGNALSAEKLAALGVPTVFDAVLIDVPCSNTGVLRHRVEVKWRLRPEDFVELPRLQLSLLRRAAALVRPGGRLVYSTCSLEPEENERVVEAFLARSADAPGESGFTLERAAHSHPWESGCDGAAAFLLRRRA